MKCGATRKDYIKNYIKALLIVIGVLLLLGILAYSKILLEAIAVVGAISVFLFLVYLVYEMINDSGLPVQ